MSQPVLLKVYGNLAPASKKLATRLTAILAECLPEQEQAPLVLDGDLLKISFEGIYFPLDEVLSLLESSLTGNESGKLDVLDLEAWYLTRYLFQSGKILCLQAPLNNVLAYSGH